MRSRQLVAPFVITVAALPACAGSRKSNVPREEPVVAHTDPPTNPPDLSSAPVPSASASTPPVETPAPQPTKTEWKIEQDGKLCSSQPIVECPRGMACNPPQPEKYECIPEQQRYPATVVRESGASECTMMVWHPTGNTHCPKGAHCNPPSPERRQIVPCPK